MLISIYISCKDVDIFATDTLNRGSGTVGPKTWFSPPKPSPQSRYLCVLCVHYQ